LAPAASPSENCRLGDETIAFGRAHSARARRDERRRDRMMNMTELGLTFASRRRSQACGDEAKPTVNAVESRAIPKGEAF